MVVERLRSKLQADFAESFSLQTQQAVKYVRQEKSGIVTVTTADGSTFRCEHILLALPPKKVAEDITLDGAEWFTPLLRKEMLRQPIWMSQMGKLALFYKECLWEPADMMGGVLCPGSVGAVQVYDAGRTGDGLYAIVCFVRGGADPHEITADHMAKIVVKQLALLGYVDEEHLANYEKAELKLWCADRHIASLKNTAPYPRPPEPIQGLNEDSSRDGSRRIWFANSEASQTEPGLLEGALQAGRFVAKKVLEKMRARKGIR